MYEKFGEGQVTNFLGTGEKMYLATAFVGQGKKSAIAKLIAKLYRFKVSKPFLNIRKNYE
jgi:hypothetical protein